jgi:hypothetical protein
MQTRVKRWRTGRWWVIALGILLLGGMLYFAVIQSDVPQYIDDTPEGLTIEFTVDQSAVLMLENCVKGRWLVTGSDEVRVNGGNWRDEASGQYTLCNQPSLSPTLEVRLPSSAIASYTLDVTVVYGNGLHVVAGLMLIFLAMWIWGVPLWSHRRLLLLVMGTHVGLVIIYQLTIDLSIINSWRWDTVVHTLKMADLRHNLLESFTYLHSQPPLFTAYGIGLDILFGSNRAEAMYAIQVILGALMCGMSYGLLWHFTRNKTITLFVALILAFNPAYFLFEALILYTIHSAFLVMSAGFCLLLYQRTAQNRYLYLFVLCINLLILIRSVYHIAFLIPILLLVILLVQENPRRVLLGCLMICLLSVGWYGKNLLVFDSFSSSSWLGMSLWKVAREDYRDSELQELLKADVLTDRSVIWSRPFMSPSAYPNFERADSDVQILSGNDFNNAVYPEINQLYQTNAIRLIQHDIGRYLKGMLRAYGHYSCPSSTYELMEKNLDTFPASHQAVSVELLHMRSLTRDLANRLGLSQDDYGACSNLYILLPMMLLGYPLYLLARCRINLRSWHKTIRRDSFLMFAWGIVTYTTIVTSLLEIPENARFKFMVEVPMFLFMVVMGYRILTAFRQRFEITL